MDLSFTVHNQSQIQNMSHNIKTIETLTNTLTPNDSMEKDLSDDPKPCEGWVKFTTQKKRKEKPILEILRESDVPTVTPIPKPLHHLSQTWAIWDHQSNAEIPKGSDWNDTMREVAIFSTVEDFWAKWSYLPLLR